MAIINNVTSYYGFTLDGTDGATPIDENGQVKRCLIAIVYPLYKNDVDVKISKGPEDWAVKMGNGEIIPLSNPVILFINRDNTIVQFDMEIAYPANSPCTLVYRSDTASFEIEERTSSRPFEINSVSGHFAFTVEGYDDDYSKDPNFHKGDVKHIVSTIPFPYQRSAVKVTISDGDDHWGARMGNGEIIPLSNPEIIATNSENVVVKFTLSKFYPSNSPCILVYMSKNASIDMKETDDDNNFYPVDNITNMPTTVIAGQTIDLNCAKVRPWNATNQYIDWSVISGSARIVNGHYLETYKGGTGTTTVTIRATIENSLEGDDSVNDYVQTFNITLLENKITVEAQPVSEMKVVVNEIMEEISVIASSNVIQEAGGRVQGAGCMCEWIASVFDPWCV